MPTIDSLNTLLVEELRDLYDAEQRLTKALPKLVKAATHEELSSAIQSHLAETEEQVSRLEEVFTLLGVPARAKACAGIRGIIEEGDEHLKEDFADDGLRDATIIGAAQRAEHYEIAAYGTALAYARLLGLDDVVGRLEETLEEEIAADQKLTEIAMTVVNLDAAAVGSGDEQADEEDGDRNAETDSSGEAAKPKRMVKMAAAGASGEPAKSKSTASTGTTGKRAAGDRRR